MAVNWIWLLGWLVVATCLAGQGVAAFELRAEDRPVVARLLPATGAEQASLDKALQVSGIQQISDRDTLLVVSAEQSAFRKTQGGVVYAHYFCILHRDRSFQLVGDFWSNAGPTPFSGGALVEGLPIIHDAVDPEHGYSHYVYWQGRYREVRTLERPDLLRLLELLFESPHTDKYLMDGSEGKSRFSYD